MKKGQQIVEYCTVILGKKWYSKFINPVFSQDNTDYSDIATIMVNIVATKCLSITCFLCLVSCTVFSGTMETRQ